MAYKIAELRAMSDDELVAFHDKEAPSATANINYFLGELDRREIRRRTDTMVRLTWAIFALTVVVAVSTVVLLIRDGSP
jgi:hypothetical protein